jgi:hypothetical protein
VVAQPKSAPLLLEEPRGEEPRGEALQAVAVAGARRPKIVLVRQERMVAAVVAEE